MGPDGEAARCGELEPMLYLIATPIGNLGDMTVRAIETLKQVDLVAAEDTRVTGRLLKHYGIKKPLMAFFEHNQARATEEVIGRLRAGDSVALVTTAGTPGIADPGFTVVRRAIEEALPVTMIPGACAAIVALVLSGLAVHSYTFRGFTPRKAGARRRFLRQTPICRTHWFTMRAHTAFWHPFRMLCPSWVIARRPLPMI